MKDSQSTVLKLFFDVSSFFGRNPELVKNDLAIKNNYNKLKAYIKELNGYIDIKETDTSGYDSLLRSKKKDLSNTIFEMASALRSYARDSHNRSLFNEFDNPITTLSKLKSLELDSYSRNCLSRLKMHQNELKPYGVSAQKIAYLQAKTNAYSTLLQLPAKTIQKKTEASEKIKYMVIKISNLLKDSIDNDMKVYESKDELLYQCYKKVRNFESNCASRVSLKGNISDKKTDSPIQYVMVSVMYKSESGHRGGVKVSSALGNYEFKNLPPGECTISFEINNYKIETVDAEINIESTTVINMSLSKKLQLQES